MLYPVNAVNRNRDSAKSSRQIFVETISITDSKISNSAKPSRQEYVKRSADYEDKILNNIETIKQTNNDILNNLKEFKETIATLTPLGIIRTMGIAAHVEDEVIPIFDSLLTYTSQQEHNQHNQVIHFLKNAKDFSELLQQKSTEIENCEHTDELAEELKFKFLAVVADFKTEEVKASKIAQLEFCKVTVSYCDTLKLLDELETKTDEAADEDEDEETSPETDKEFKNWSLFANFIKVHADPNKSQQDKTAHLERILKDSGSPLMPPLNYDETVDVLINRYKQIQILFDNWVDKLLDLPEIKSTKAENIKSLLHGVEAFRFFIEDMGLDFDASKRFIARMITKKFDDDIRRQYEKSLKKGDSLGDLEDVLEFLKQLEKEISSEYSNVDINTNTQGLTDAKQSFMVHEAVAKQTERANAIKDLDKVKQDNMSLRPILDVKSDRVVLQFPPDAASITKAELAEVYDAINEIFKCSGVRMCATAVDNCYEVCLLKTSGEPMLENHIHRLRKGILLKTPNSEITRAFSLDSPGLSEAVIRNYYIGMGIPESLYQFVAPLIKKYNSRNMS